jgi:hypothetical protein
VLPMGFMKNAIGMASGKITRSITNIVNKAKVHKVEPLDIRICLT